MLARKKSDIKAARRDPARFVEYAFPNEKTGKVIRNEDFHREWHEFFSENRWSVLISPIEHGKTVSIGLGRTIWEMGNDPGVRILLVGESKPAAKKLLRNIKKHIERNPKVREVFPHLRRSPDPEDPWTSEDITIARKGLSRDPTIQARGVNSESILGSRLDLIVLDDVLNMRNTATQLSRDKTVEWFDTTVFSRIQDEYDAKGNLVQGGRCYVIGTPWHRDDLLHRLKARKGWSSRHYSAVLNYKEHESKWKSLWPRVWPVQRLIDKRDGMEMNLTSFSRKLLCQVMTDSMRRFKDAWLSHMFALGKKRVLLDRAPRGPQGKFRCVTGVDLGVGKKKKDARTVLFTIAIDPRSGKRIVVDVESGKWDGPTIVQKIKHKNWRYDSIVIVESNAAQKFIAQFAAAGGVPTVAHHTGQHNKNDEEFGVESLAVEMRAGLWVAPSGKDGLDIDEELLLWKQDMEDYQPELHTGDHLMASWMAREGARKWMRKMNRDEDHNRR